MIRSTFLAPDFPSAPHNYSCPHPCSPFLRASLVLGILYLVWTCSGHSGEPTVPTWPPKFGSYRKAHVSVTVRCQKNGKISANSTEKTVVPGHIQLGGYRLQVPFPGWSRAGVLQTVGAIAKGRTGLYLGSAMRTEQFPMLALLFILVAAAAGGVMG